MVDSDDPAGRFWRFALAVYLPEENRRLFLRLQDAAGMDVPLVLFCLWCGAEGLRLSEASMRAAVAFSEGWRRGRVEPLRALRRAWKDAPGPLPPALSEAARQRVAEAEQAVERLQMDHLADLRAGTPDTPDAARYNLAFCCRIAALVPDPDDLAAVARLAEAQVGQSP